MMNNGLQLGVGGGNIWQNPQNEVVQQQKYKLANEYAEHNQFQNHDSLALNFNDKDKSFEDKIKAKSAAMLARKRSQMRGGGH